MITDNLFWVNTHSIERGVFLTNNIFSRKKLILIRKQIINDLTIEYRKKGQMPIISYLLLAALLLPSIGSLVQHVESVASLKMLELCYMILIAL